MTTSAVALCNGALRLLGAEALTSFDEGSELAETCNIIYATTVRGLLSRHPWRFTMAKAQLSRLADPPTNEWRHQFAQPADMMVLRHLFPTSAIRATPVRDYEIFESRICANEPALWADYQRETDPATWPPHFAELARAALASDLAMAVTNSTSAAEMWRGRAYGTPQEAGNGGLMRAARTVDAQQQPPAPMYDFPLLAARHGGA